MADDANDAGAAGDAGETKKKGGMGPLIIGLALALTLGGGAAYGVMSGMIPTPFGPEDPKAALEETKPEKPAVFVEFEPLTLTIGLGPASRQLRLTFAVETEKEHEKTIDEMRPRILDTLNTLLRAVDDEDLNAPYALDRLRAQMTRRVRIAVGPEFVRDVLIVQYVIL